MKNPFPRQLSAFFSGSKRLLKFLGSLGFAVFMLAFLSVILGITTFVEAKYGTPVVQYFVYQSRWFYGLLFVFGLNILASMLLRFPWERRHVPFLCVHSGILVLLLGCLITAKYKKEANLTIAEGKSARFATAEGYHISITPEFLHTKTEKNFFSPDSPGEGAGSSLSSLMGDSEEQYAQRMEKEHESEIRIPFQGGPFNWDLYRRKNWFGEKSRSSDVSLWFFMQMTGRQKGTVYRSDSVHTEELPKKIHVEVLDFLNHSTLRPADPMQMRVSWINPDSPTAKNPDSEPVEMLITPQIGYTYGSPFELGWGSAHRSGNGARITFRVAQSRAETDAFLNSAPENLRSGLGTISLFHEGKKYDLSLDELVKRRIENETQLGEIQSRIGELMHKRTQLREEKEKANSLDPDESLPGSFSKAPKSTAQWEHDLESLDREIMMQYKRRTTLQNLSRAPLGNTNYTIGLSSFLMEGASVESEHAHHEPSQRGKNLSGTGPMISLYVYSPDDQLDALVLFSARPDLNSHAEKFCIYGTYVLDVPYSREKASAVIPEQALDPVESPRLDILQSPRGELFYRFWNRREFLDFGEISQRETTRITPKGEKMPQVEISGVKFTPQDLPGYKILPLPFRKDYASDPRVKIRLHLGTGNEEIFWIRAGKSRADRLDGSVQEDQVRWFSHEGKLLRIEYKENVLDLGFTLYLQRFMQRNDPGTRVAAQYSSLVDLRGPESFSDRMDLIRFTETPEHHRKSESGSQNPKKDANLRENVLIKMNQPGRFRDQKTGRTYSVYQSSYRGPFSPETPRVHSMYEALYDKRILPGETRPRESIFISVLSVNYDPGRGLKYLASAMMVFGTLWVFCKKRRRA